MVSGYPPINAMFLRRVVDTVLHLLGGNSYMAKALSFLYNLF